MRQCGLDLKHMDTKQASGMVLMIMAKWVGARSSEMYCLVRRLYKLVCWFCCYRVLICNWYYYSEQRLLKPALVVIVSVVIVVVMILPSTLM